MPGVIDKLLLNRSTFRGDSACLDAAFKAGKKLGKEIEEAEAQHPGIMKRAHQKFTQQQESICSDLDAGMSKSIQAQRILCDEIRLWLDDELGLNQP